MRPKEALTKLTVRSLVLMVLATLTELRTSGDNPRELEKRGGPYQTQGGTHQSQGEKPNVDGAGDSNRSIHLRR
jgi:hypothetical protein